MSVLTSMLPSSSLHTSRSAQMMMIETNYIFQPKIFSHLSAVNSKKLEIVHLREHFPVFFGTL